MSVTGVKQQVQVYSL